MSIFTSNPNNDYPEEKDIQNESLDHEECSDDRPSNADKVPVVDFNTGLSGESWGSSWGTVEEKQEEFQTNGDKDKSQNDSNENQKPVIEAVIPSDTEVREEEKPEDSGAGNGDRFDRLEALLDSLFEKVDEFQVTIDKQQDIIKKQKREIERYHDDEVNKKIRQPILLDLIEVMDSMDMALEDYDRNLQVGVLVDQMEAIRKLMKATLENYNVREVDDAEKQPTVVSRRQQVVGREVSDNPELFEIAGEQVNSFYKRERAGYVMCDENVDGEPRETVLRPEDVIRVVYRAHED